MSDLHYIEISKLDIEDNPVNHNASNHYLEKFHLFFIGLISFNMMITLIILGGLTGSWCCYDKSGIEQWILGSMLNVGLPCFLSMIVIDLYLCGILLEAFIRWMFKLNMNDFLLL